MKYSILRHVGATAMCATLMCLSVSCRKDLCYDHFRKSAVTLDYEQEWERDYGRKWSESWHDGLNGQSYDLMRPGVPSTVSMGVYPSEGQNPYEVYLEAGGGEASLGQGPYDILFYNNDTEYVVINDIASLPKATATTRSRSRATLMDMHYGERTVSPPDVLYGAYVEGVADVGAHNSTPILATLRPLVYTYVVRYEIEEGLDGVALVRGALAGMAESVYLLDGSTDASSATVLFDGDLTSWGAVANVRTFGVPDYPGDHYNRSDRESPARFTLNLEVRLTDGSIKSYNYDVSDQMADQPRGGIITVSGIRIDPPVPSGGGGSGFVTDVDDWGEWVDVDLPITGAQHNPDSN